MSERMELASSPCFADEAALGLAPDPHNDIAVLVLAGGEGRRMGGDKPMRLLAGRPLLRHAMDRARAYGVVAAIGVRSADQAQIDNTCERVVDAPGIAGPLAGLAAGLAWAQALGKPWLLTLPCDAPFLPPDLARVLRSLADAHGVPVALPESGGRLHPACGLWSTNLRERVREYAESGRSSLLGFARESGFAQARWAVCGSDLFANLNTPEDLALAEARLS